MEVRILEEGEMALWNSLVEQFPGRTLFHTAEWLGFLETTFHLQNVPLALYRDGRMVGLFPALLDRKGPFKIFGSPLTGWGTAYMGPLIDDGLLDEAMDAVDGFARRMGVDYLEIRLPEDHRRLPRMETYDHQVGDTWILGLDCSQDQAWARLSRDCRNRVRKAQKSGVQIVEGQERECVKEVYSMFVAAFASRGTTTSHSLQYFYDLWDALKPHGMIRVLLAEYEGKRIAGAIFVMNADTAYLVCAGSQSEYNKVAPNNLVHWHFISSALRDGLRKYDMSGKGVEGIDRFKESFGCHVASYNQYSKASSSLAKVGKRVYRAAATGRLALQYQLNRCKSMIRRRE